MGSWCAGVELGREGTRVLGTDADCRCSHWRSSLGECGVEAEARTGPGIGPPPREMGMQ